MSVKSNSGWGYVVRGTMRSSHQLGVAKTLFRSTSILAIASAAATAQQAGPAATAGGVEAADQLETIMVTATRVSENIRDVPESVTAVDPQKLAALNDSGYDLRSLAGQVPSLNVETSDGRTMPRFYIRGLGNTDFDPNAQQPVSVVVDDIPLDNSAIRSFPIFDQQSVEVLRGPQGTLFGRNTPAGVVKFDSVKPGDEFNGYGDLSWGTYNTLNAEGAYGGPLGDGFSFRISGVLQRRDDWITNTSTTGVAPKALGGYIDGAARLQIRYVEGDFDALLNIHGRAEDGNTQVYHAGSIQPGSNNFLPGFQIDRVALDGAEFGTTRQGGSNLHLSYHFDGVGTLYSITSYEVASVDAATDVDGGNVYHRPPVGLNVGSSPSNTGGYTQPRETSQELRMVTDKSHGLQIQGGLYYLDQQLYYTETTWNALGDLLPGYVIHHDSNQDVGVYGSGTYSATDALTLGAGVRYSTDSKRDLVGGVPPVPGLTAGLVLPIVTRLSGGNVSWDASATDAVDEHVNLYARAATGYLGGAIQDRATNGSFPVTAKPEVSTSGEVGTKTVWLDNRLTFDADVFYMSTRDLQLTAVGGTTNSAHLINVDKAISEGVEWELQARPLPNLLLNLGGSYNFTEILDPSVSVATCGSKVCTPTDPLNAAGRALLDHNPLPQAPRYISDASARYSITLPNGASLFAYTDWSYRSSVNFKLYTASEFEGKALILGGLKLGYATSGNTEIAVFGRNILNKVVFVGASDFNNLDGFVSEPRIVGVQIHTSL